MEKLISKEFLTLSKPLNEEKLILNLSKVIHNLFEKEDKLKKGIFLSHKHSDKELVYEIVKLFKKLEVDVYIDWLDDDMPKETDAETALIIRDKIKSSKKFILLATDDAINSKWCNWELGFGDAQKYFKNIAILPVTNTNNGLWTGNEYFKIYPAITIRKDNNELFVEFLGEKEKFIDWLNKS